MGQFRASGTQAVSCSRQAPCAPVSLGTLILPLRSNDVLSSVSACQHHESFGGPGLRSLCSGLPSLCPSSRGVEGTTCPRSAHLGPPCCTYLCVEPSEERASRVSVLCWFQCLQGWHQCSGCPGGFGLKDLGTGIEVRFVWELLGPVSLDSIFCPVPSLHPYGL